MENIESQLVKRGCRRHKKFTKKTWRYHSSKNFNPNLYKNKSYDIKYEVHALFMTYIKSIKFMSYDLFVYKFGLNIFPWGMDFFMSIGKNTRQFPRNYHDKYIKWYVILLYYNKKLIRNLPSYNLINHLKQNLGIKKIFKYFEIIKLLENL